ncbi:MAG TPA: alpha/beta fold hydrolase [Thermoanaerobaculia bacterium]|nr:alpha/beta fold hydrolase [Thermoanaerobaculia bacterium]
MGELEEPSIWRFERREDPKKHVVLLAVQPQRASDFYAKLGGSIAASDRGEVFIFIHGYKNTFADAVRRTAQIKYDLGFDGAAIAYSWPSGGALADYSADEGTVDWTVPHLAAFLNDLAQRTGARAIHVVAHSMGNRVMAQALARLATPETRAKFSQVVLAAPDIDADVFKRDLAPALLRLSSHVTLYASSRDKALNASKRLHQSPRAGEAGKNITIVAGVDTIDVSAVDTSLLGHAYVADNQTVLSDVFCLLRGAITAPQRCRLSAARAAAGRYWRFSAVVPEQTSLARYVCSPRNCQNSRP